MLPLAKRPSGILCILRIYPSLVVTWKNTCPGQSFSSTYIQISIWSSSNISNELLHKPPGIRSHVQSQKKRICHSLATLQDQFWSGEMSHGLSHMLDGAEPPEEVEYRSSTGHGDEPYLAFSRLYSVYIREMKKAHWVGTQPLEVCVSRLHWLVRFMGCKWSAFQWDRRSQLKLLLSYQQQIS